MEEHPGTTCTRAGGPLAPPRLELLSQVVSGVPSWPERTEGHTLASLEQVQGAGHLDQTMARAATTAAAGNSTFPLVVAVRWGAEQAANQGIYLFARNERTNDPVFITYELSF
jgi:hypothetical protein